jgi:hypothetical protein
LEWDPVNRHIRTWVFSPHVQVPENLVQAIRTAGEPVIENRVLPDPQEWPLPYGYFAVGKKKKIHRFCVLSVAVFTNIMFLHFCLFQATGPVVKPRIFET